MMTRKAVLEKAVMTVLDKEPVHISSVTGVLRAECLQEIQGGPLLTGYTTLYTYRSSREQHCVKT